MNSYNRILQQTKGLSALIYKRKFQPNLTAHKGITQNSTNLSAETYHRIMHPQKTIHQWISKDLKVVHKYQTSLTSFQNSYDRSS